MTATTRSLLLDAANAAAQDAAADGDGERRAEHLAAAKTALEASALAEVAEFVPPDQAVIEALNLAIERLQALQSKFARAENETGRRIGAGITTTLEDISRLLPEPPSAE